MAFFQAPPQLGNQYDDDATVREYVSRVLPADVAAQVEDEYRELGERAGGELYRDYLNERNHEPEHTAWDPWGHRIDHIEVSPLWKKAQVLSAEHGLVAAGYEGRFGASDRVHQFLANYLVQASLDVYSCPLAMTDGAAKTLLSAGDPQLIERAFGHLTSRDPKHMWTSGQWMTERTGGSDVGKSETTAVEDGDHWKLYGTKWFTSATTSEMSLALARPDGNGPGGKGLALFYIELRNDAGRMQNIQVNRLKDKFGTRKVPTAELTLDGTPARLVGDAHGGVKRITPMLNVTRTWNAVAASWFTRRIVALARDYAGKRRAFGAALVEKPLHRDTLAGLVAESDATFHLAFRAVELLGKSENGEFSETDELLFRALTPITKLTTAKQAVQVVSEGLECFGGAGYIEDTGLPRLYADAQVLPIWEGTTNVLSLDTLRALSADGAFGALTGEIRKVLANGAESRLAEEKTRVEDALEHASGWLGKAMHQPAALEAGARRLALTLGRSYQLALMIRHAAGASDGGNGRRAQAAARRFAAHGIDSIRDNHAPEDDARLIA